MLKRKNAAKLLFTLLMLLSSSLLGISMLPTEIAKAETSLATDMPVVYVDPQVVSASLGESFTVSVKIFNLSDNFYTSDDVWIPGGPLPPYDPDALGYNYSLGNLFGLDIQFRWDPTLLEYANHTVKIPVENYSDGVLHEPILDVVDSVDAEAGTYQIAKSSFGKGVQVFNSPGGNATVFNMTFNVKKRGKCVLELTSVDLVPPFVRPEFEDVNQMIPRWVNDGQFRTEALATRIEKVEVGALVDDSFFTPPLISGENATVKITSLNDGNSTDTYNLTLRLGDTHLQTWESETLEPAARKTFNYTIDEGDLAVGDHTLTAEATVSHWNGTHFLTLVDRFDKTFEVVAAPSFEISGPSSATAGESVSFTASVTSGQISYYHWTLTRRGETDPRSEEEGENMTDVTFELDPRWPGGSWDVALEVTDIHGIKYLGEERPATEPYREVTILEVAAKGAPGFFTLENIALIAILIVIIALAVVYLRRRSR